MRISAERKKIIIGMYREEMRQAQVLEMEAHRQAEKVEERKKAMKELYIKECLERQLRDQERRNRDMAERAMIRKASEDEARRKEEKRLKKAKRTSIGYYT